jgi:hypothetical protein
LTGSRNHGEDGGGLKSAALGVLSVSFARAGLGAIPRTGHAENGVGSHGRNVGRAENIFR